MENDWKPFRYWPCDQRPAVEELRKIRELLEAQRERQKNSFWGDFWQASDTDPMF